MALKEERQELNEMEEKDQCDKQNDRIIEEKSFSCSQTEYTSQKEANRSYLTCQQQPFTCPQCGRGFTYKTTFNAHMRIHTGEQPYTCPTCGRSFRQKTTFNAHMRVHTGEKPFTCQQCEKSKWKMETLKNT